MYHLCTRPHNEESFNKQNPGYVPGMQPPSYAAYYKPIKKGTGYGTFNGDDGGTGGTGGTGSNSRIWSGPNAVSTGASGYGSGSVLGYNSGYGGYENLPVAKFSKKKKGKKNEPVEAVVVTPVIISQGTGGTGWSSGEAGSGVGPETLDPDAAGAKRSFM